MNEDPRPFLTIVALPDGFHREETARLLAEEAGFDFTTIRMRLGREAPMLLEQLDADRARRAVSALVRHGGDAFAVTLAQLARMGATMKIKSMEIKSGNVAVELWQGLSTVIHRDDIQVLIRAQLSSVESKVDVAANRGITTSGGFMGSPTSALLGGRHGAGGLAAGFAGAYITADAVPVERTTTINTSDLLDIHTQQGHVYQVDANRFGFQVLGQQRGHGDHANMNRLCDLLAHICPNEIVDPYYTLWRAPAGVQRLKLRPRDDDPSFAFYSRWAALLYRHLLG